MKILGLITARGGSKRLPGKNVIELGGKPLLAWSVLLAKQCDLLTKVVLSTDSEEIATVGRAYGAEVPFTRPKELAGDNAPHLDVLQHALNWYREKGETFDLLMLLQPTSPFRSIEHLEDCVSVAKAHPGCAVKTVVRTTHPEFCRRLNKDGTLEPILGTQSPGYLRSQDFEPVYTTNGAVYLWPTDVITSGNIDSVPTRAVEMNAMHSMDIDSLEDLEIARALVSAGVIAPC
jgi:CMP-N-acetylneuraminic acid synthetase